MSDATSVLIAAEMVMGNCETIHILDNGVNNDGTKIVSFLD